MENQEQEILSTLEGDIKTLKEPLKETITEIVSQGYSNYPILIAHIEDMNFADKIIDKSLFNTAFHFSASTLEAMLSKGIILEDRREAFEEKIKASEGSACILLLHPEVMKFVFFPLT